MKRFLTALLAGFTVAVAVQAADGDPPTKSLKLPPVPLALPPANAAKAPGPMPVVATWASAEKVRTQNVVRLSGANNELIYISATMPNRIATPFSTPSVIGVGEDDASYEVVGQNVFIVPVKNGPIGLYIMDNDNQSAMPASLTLVPQNIPSQNIVLQFDQPAPSVARAQQEAPASSDYVEGIRYIMRSVAQGAAPSGFVESVLKVGSTLTGGLSITPDRQYVGSRATVYRYIVENVTRATIELNETAFNDRGVRAVSFWPDARLEPGQRTNVLVLADNPLVAGEQR